MSGYTYGSKEPTARCPYCGTECYADFCDVGVGMVQCGPYHCENCGASEIGGYDKPRELSEREEQTGWYAPHSEPGSSANVIDGRIVSADVMRDIYRRANELHPENFATEQDAAAWFAGQRREKTVDELKAEVARRFVLVKNGGSQ